MHVALVVGRHNCIVGERHGRQTAMEQRLLAPDLCPRTAPQGDDLTGRIGDIDGVVIEGNAPIARGVVRPPNLARVEREHGDAALETYGEDILTRDARCRIDVDEAFQLGTAMRGSHRGLPLQRAVIHVYGDDLAIVEPTKCELACDHRS